MGSDNPQTQKLIAAADISSGAAKVSSQAASDFSNSARSINLEIKDAVDKLSLQASTAEAARQSSAQQSQKALQATIDNLHDQERPWLGVKDFKCSQCGINLDRLALFKKEVPYDGAQPMDVVGFAGTLINLGKTPAQITKVEIRIIGGAQAIAKNCIPDQPGSSICPSGFLPQYDATTVRMTEAPFDPFAFDPGHAPLPGVVVPDSPLPFPIETGMKEFWIIPNAGVVNPENPAVYVQGTIRYTAVWGGDFETDFCVFASPNEQGKLGFCTNPGSNSMR